MFNSRISILIVFLHVFKYTSYTILKFVCIQIVALHSQRRIQSGMELKTDKKYLVYFVNSEKSENSYQGWTCGGAIVSPNYILTAAACVEDVHYLYVIAGYRTHVEYADIDTDPCTKEMKRKIVYTCVPKSYEFDYGNVVKWSAIDIAVAKVEKPFDADSKFQSLCSYIPEPIKVNYDPKYQAPGIDAIVMGWGHLERWRMPEDKTSYLQKKPHYAPTEILNKAKCKQMYSDFPSLQNIIDKYMICTKGSGNLDDDGNFISTLKPTAEECTNENPFCRRTLENGTYRNVLLSNATFDARSRRQGICQNDHGGPLVTWIGGRQVLIGVASVFRVNSESKCEGPYLFTSTQCNAAFLYCLLNKDSRRQGSICDQQPEVRGFDMIHKYISWDNHPDRKTTETIKIRPQIPINQFG